MTTKRKVPETLVVPDTIEGVAGLLTAFQWERAAIVYAWTKPEVTGRPRKDGKSSKTTGLYGIREFAALKLAGLRSDRTVQNYRDAWVFAIEHGEAQHIKPGDTVQLPKIKFPPGHNPAWAESDYDDDYAEEAESHGVSYGTAKRAGANKAAIEAAIKADPEVAKAARRALDARAKRDAEAYYENASVPREDLEEKIAAHEAEDKRFNEMWDDLLKDADRVSTLRQLQRVAEVGRDKMQAIANDSTPTGVDAEIEMLHKTVAALMDWQWAASSYIFDPATK